MSSFRQYSSSSKKEKKKLKTRKYLFIIVYIIKLINTKIKNKVPMTRYSLYGNKMSAPTALMLPQYFKVIK